jgi:hypothetical protein
MIRAQQPVIKITPNMTVATSFRKLLGSPEPVGAVVGGCVAFQSLVGLHVPFCNSQPMEALFGGKFQLMVEL